jgi:hypothetical protein
MQSEQLFHGQFSRLLARTQAGFALIVLLSIAGFDFFFPSQYRWQAGLHGISSIASLIAGTFLTHRAYPLIKGIRADFSSLRQWATASAALNFLALASGNWIYMRYRGEAGPREWILKHTPSFHNNLMEFKEFVSIFPFPLMLCVSFLLFYYGKPILQRRELTQLAGLLILLSWAFLVLGFAAGLVLAKLSFV